MAGAMRMSVWAIAMLLVATSVQASGVRKLLQTIDPSTTSAAEIIALLNEGKELPTSRRVPQAPAVGTQGGGAGFIATVQEAQIEQRERVEEMNAPTPEPVEEPAEEPAVEPAPEPAEESGSESGSESGFEPAIAPAFEPAFESAFEPAEEEDAESILANVEG